MVQGVALVPPFPASITPAELQVIDFRLLIGDHNADESRRLFDAAQGCGFFLLKHHGVDPEPMFTLSHSVLGQLPAEEKMKYDMGATGHYFGYRAIGSRLADLKGTPDKTEFYNISKDDVLGSSEERAAHPAPILHRWSEIANFIRCSHRVTCVILHHLAINLGLDPHRLTNLHSLDRQAGDQVRLTSSPAASADPLSGELEPEIFLAAHTDFGSVTVLFNKLGGLQALNPATTEWKYVRPEPGCAVINLGDALVKLLGGRVHSGLHRVVTPPGEQATVPRSSVVYFARPNGSIRLQSIVDGDAADPAAPTADEWIARRVFYGATANYVGQDSAAAGLGTEHTLKAKL